MGMRLPHDLSPNASEKGLGYVVKDGITSQAMITLTSGVFLTAFALQLGAPMIVLGIIAAISPLAQLLQIPTVSLVERLRNRKMVTLFSATTSRTLLLLIAAIPFIARGTSAIIALLIGLIAYSAAGAVGNCSWNSWMRDLIPEKRLGWFFSRRLGYAVGVSIIVSIAAGWLIDHMRTAGSGHAVYAYSILFFSAMIFGYIGLYFIYRIPEPKMGAPEKIPFKHMLSGPWRDTNFRNTMMYLGVWNFATNLAVPFFAVYMLGFMKLNVLLVTVLTIVSQAINVWSFHLWGSFSDRYSNRAVLAVSGPMLLAAILAWTFVMLPGPHALSIPLLVLIHVLTGLAQSGILLATGNITLKLAPKGKATAYLTSSSIVNSLATGGAPVIGGALADLFARMQLSLTFNWQSPFRSFSFNTLDFQGWDFLFFFAFLIGLYALHLLSKVQEEGDVHERVVWQEFMAASGRELRTFTVSGLTGLISFPVMTLKRTLHTRPFDVFRGLFRQRR